MNDLRKALPALANLSLEGRQRSTEVLTRHLPQFVAAKVEAGLTEFLDEERVLTTLFCGFGFFEVGVQFSVPNTSAGLSEGRT
jgi:hypothetical protein